MDKPSSPTISMSTSKPSSSSRRSCLYDKNSDQSTVLEEDSKKRSSSAVVKDDVTLTPHMVRLLKLVQEGSQDHARLAAQHLQELTASHSDDASSSSPLVLWEILGRLQGFLGAAADWQTRANAGLAMEGVAKNLPKQDQAAFLQDEHGKGQEGWLTVPDVTDHWDTILEQGRELMASAESKYQVEREEQVLEDLAMTTAANIASDGRVFCERRLELQRQILSRRLGLSAVMTRYSDSVGGKFQQNLVVQGLEAMEQPDMIISTEEDSRPKKKRRGKKKSKEFISSTPELPKSIRSLLVMEIRQQQEHTPENDFNQQAVSHRNPQHLLAGELVYRMFDPSWHVRHGSLMGILALLRAWKIHQQATGDIHFGTWPHDILARTLCVLALDRFGDFSGTSTEAFSGAMVAPVREVAAQVFSVVFFMAPSELQQHTFGVLSKMMQSDEWEVRQGVMLSLKYCLAMVNSTKAPAVSNGLDHNFESKIIGMAIDALEDISDDVQGVAAQILERSLLEDTAMEDSRISDSIVRIVPSLWKTMAKIRPFSSSLENLVTLFCQTIKSSPEVSVKMIAENESIMEGMVKIFHRLCVLLDSEFVSVKTSIVHVVGSLARQIPIIIKGQSEGICHQNMQQYFCSVVKTLFNLQWQFSILEHNDGTCDARLLLQECSDTWTVLSTIQDHILGTSNPLRFDLEKDLLSTFFKLNRITASDVKEMVKASYAGKLSVLTDMAGFLSTFWTLGQLSNSCNLLVYTILAGFNSPLIYHCEASCCLVRSVFHSIAKATPNNAATMTEKLWPCVRHLMKTLQNVPSCLALHLQQIILDQKNIDMFVFAFQGGFKVALDSNSGEKAAAAVLDLWEQLIPPSQSKSRVDAATINSMRMLSQVSGSLLSVGITALPEKMTPVVRPLMTSLQNEQDKQCQIANCNFLFTFLALLQGPAPAERVAGFHKTFAKVVSNLCNFVVSGDEPSCSTASLVIGSLVGNAPSGHSLLSFSPLSRHVLPIFESWTNSDMNSKHNALLITKAACQGLRPGIAASESIIRESIAPLTQISCDEVDVSFQDLSSDIVKQLCGVDDALVLNLVMPVLIGLLKDDSNDMHRNRACFLLGEILEVVKNPATIAPYVRILLPVVMSLMTDTIRACAETAARVFSCLVQLAPLVKLSSCLKPDKAKKLQEADLVIDHLIHGEKLPPCDIPVPITEALTTNGIVLRNYQIEGISWLRFLQSMKLNGALCDSMGLGKTLQALVAIALAHLDSNLESKRKPMSLIVCPSSVVGHWMNEIRRFFPGKKLFRSTSLIGGTNQRKAILDGQFTDCNVVVTSYAVMRGEIDKLSKLDWIYAILDEGHLLKNPKTVTARASRRLRARHRLILTGTPVMNKVQEVWATFDFLMPNFLGSSDHFLKEFARPISKGQKLDAAAFDVAAGMEKLKILHQQVLPFILRREKGQVLKELPPKIVTRIPCSMSALQGELYRHFCSGTQGKQSLITLHKLSHPDSVTDENIVAALNSNVLKSLLYLRLLCTHPWLVRSKNGKNEAMKKFFTIETSGKLLALLEIFRECGIKTQEHTAADGDSSLLYCDKDGNESLDANEYEAVVSADCTDLEDGFDNSDCGSSRCLVFAQFMDSLDVVEELVLKRFMPSVKYLRLDGRVAAAKRSNIVNNFNSDENIKVLLLTTKIGGLGLNLTGADTVIFLEHDWNPHTDLQAMDRAHRLGQKKTVHVYKLVTQNSIEETTMAIHERKLAMSSAIVNTENSSLYSMGTEKLLDIFSASAARSEIAADFEDNLDALVERYQDEYQSLSMEGFVKSFQLDDGKVKDQSA